MHRLVRHVVSVGMITLLVGVSGSFFLATALQSALLPVRLAEIVEVQGETQVQQDPHTEWIAARVGAILYEGAQIRTGAGASCRLILRTGDARDAFLEMQDETDITFAELARDAASESDKTHLKLAVGEVLVKTKKLRRQSAFEVSTPTSVVGVQGTVFSIQFQAASAAQTAIIALTLVGVLEGKVDFNGAPIKQGEFGEAQGGAPPQITQLSGTLLRILQAFAKAAEEELQLSSAEHVSPAASSSIALPHRGVPPPEPRGVQIDRIEPPHAEPEHPSEPED